MRYKILLCIILLLFIIPVSFAGDNNTLDDNALSVSNDNDILTSSSIYFNSSVEIDGNGSLESPYKYLNSNRLSDNSVAYFSDGSYELNGILTFSNLTIIGQSPLNTIINGNSSQFISQKNLNVYNITLNSLTIQNKKYFTATNVIFENNSGCYKDRYDSIFGGVIYSTGIETKIESSIFRNNSADYGGAIYSDDSDLKIINSTFENNHAYKYGGAIAIEKSSTLNVYNSTFNNCHALTNAGGAIYTMNSKLDVRSSNFTQCNATFGGAICDLRSDSYIHDIIAMQNTANYQGGAIYKMYGRITVSSSSFLSNKASSGGAIFADNSSSFTVQNSKFNLNNATDDGGAIYSILNSNEVITNNTYINNTASTENDYLKVSSYNMFIGNDNYTQFIGNFTFNGTLPSSYDLRDYGWVTPVKNQKTSGNCWAFTALAALESCILKATGLTYDLSEENMKNVMGFFSDYGWKLETNNGGYASMGIGYLVSWLGAINDDLDDFSDYSVISPVINSSIHVQNVVYLTRSSYTDNDAIKEAIIRYGAVATGIYYKSTYLKSNSYYYAGGTSTNHAITIVGWDDNYSRSNFKSTPPGDGAWICKNSWGESWGDEGYFYVSYYDKSCARVGDYDKSTYTFILNDTVYYDKNYQYDIIGITDYFITGRDTIWYANVFNATGDELLTAFSTYFNATTNWTAQIYVNDELKLTQNGTSNAGYYTIGLDEFIPLKMGDAFKIAIKISCDKYASFPVSEKVRSNRDLYSYGVSFFSTNGRNWVDLYNYKYNASRFGHSYLSQVACIKAFTLNNLNTTIALNVSDIVDLNKEFNITAIVKDQYGTLVNYGNVTFYLDSNEYTVPVVKGIANIKAKLASCGIYSVNATYIDNGYYFNSSISSVINVSILSADLTLKIGNISYGENLTVENSLVSNGLNISANITVVIDSKTYIIQSNSKTVIYDILNPGNYTAIGYYSNISTANTTFNVAKLPMGIDLNISKTDVDAVEIIVSLLQNINATVLVEVNSDSYNVTISNGNGLLKLFNLDYGNYTVNASFSSEIYQDAFASEGFSIDNVKTHLDADNLVMYYRDGTRFVVTLLDKNNQTIENQIIRITLNGVSYQRTTDAKGKASMAINLNSANYTVFIVYCGDEKYLPSNLTRNITIKSTIISSNVVKYYRNATQFYATILDFNGNKVVNTEVEMNINGVFYKRLTNSEGVVRLNLNLNPSTYILTLTNPVTGEVTSNNVTILSRLVENHDLVKYFRNDSKYSVKLLDEKGSPLSGVYVMFNINGVFYNRLTDSNGVASLAINLYPGTYVITAQYDSSLVSNTIKVLTTVETENIEMYYRDGTAFKARILDGNGNPNPGVNVTFNINGVLYNRLTNSSGVAKLNINLVAGKYIITSSYNGLSTSNTILIKSI